MGRCQLGDTVLLYVVMEYAGEDLSQFFHTGRSRRRKRATCSRRLWTPWHTFTAKVSCTAT